ncbi:Uncharacterized protein dnm_026670 [Desulfonema magnum]|uniref:Uncharacterized protein n=1 Tax=Desulfonema magnum TaxID=45655 RepID=A0A975BK87_9BACT|nr:Uncharacterized protein dnm_026670 [Desulfonema magnum]
MMMQRFRKLWIPAFTGMTEKDLIIEYQRMSGQTVRGNGNC